MEPLISVIVPAFNQEIMLRQTLESIIAQDFGAFEILLVNDGSSDRTGPIAMEVFTQSRFNNYKIISYNNNMGVSHARNMGLDSACGKFVVFLDSDDLFDCNMLSLLYEEAERVGDDCDLVICGHRELEHTTGHITNFPLPCKRMLGKTIDELIIMRILNIMEPALSTLYRKTFLDSCSLRFHENCLTGEDGEFFIKALCRCRKIGIVNACPYIYVQHESMGDRQHYSKYVLIKRYEDDKKAVRRYTKYIARYSNSAAIHEILNTYLTPQTCHKTLSVCAMKDNRLQFYAYLKKLRFRKIMLRSKKHIFIRPEIFFKTIFIILFPSKYYNNYNHRYK